VIRMEWRKYEILDTPPLFKYYPQEENYC
jgi:hypothetical protein